MLGLWAIVGLVLSIEVYFNVRVNQPNVTFGDVAIPQYIRALYWAALSRAVLTLRLHVPLRSGHWVGGILFHGAMSFLFMATFFLGRMLLVLVVEAQTLAGFWETANRSFFGRNLIDMAFYWGVLVYGHIQDLRRRAENEQLKVVQIEGTLAESELKALKEQLHPHFLFNTLNTISVLVRENRNEEAVRLLAQLGSLLRMSLDSTRVHEVTLRQEMAFLDPYIEIQKARFLDRLSVRTRISAEALDARVPSLLLQPIVENAIVHGIAAKSSPGMVEVNGTVRDGKLFLSVKDDGPGFKTRENGRAREGIGLSNTRQRLATIYGSHYQLLLRSERGMGTSVEIVLPFRT